MRNRSNNPVFKRALNSEFAYDGASATYMGVAGKVFYYIGMVLIGAFGGLLLSQTNPEAFGTLLVISLFTTFIFGLVAMLSPRLSRVMGTLYCLAQGMVVGVVSLVFEAAAPGVVLIAITSTLVVLIVVATLFLTNLVKVNGKFMRFLTVFSISVLISMLIIWILSFTLYRGVAANSSLGYFRSNIIISLIMVFLATLYLFFDLEYIRQVVEGGAPKMMEWYVAFGLVFTIVWLYMEILPIVFRILARDN